MTKTVALPAISGAQQSAIGHRFHNAGWRVRGTGRTAKQTRFGQALQADLESGDGLEAAFAGVDVVVLTLPQDHRTGVMANIALRVAQAAAAASAGRLVLNTAGVIDEEGQEPLFQDMKAARRAVFDADLPSVALQPTVFMDNLLAPWSLPGIVNDGVLAYPAPENAPISWLSHRSLADFVFAASTNAKALHQGYLIGGPAPLTGADLAKILSVRLEKPVRYMRIPLQEFSAGLNKALGEPAGDRIASLYKRLERQPRSMATDNLAAEALGVAPETFAEFARRTCWAV